jgi:hypothetical protein
MAEKWQLGGYSTNTIVGKALKAGSMYATINAAGACFQIANANYQVTAGKTYYICGMYIVSNNTAAHTGLLRYADDAALTTNPVDLAFQVPRCTVAFTPGQMPLIPIFGTVPAGKYVGIYNAAAVAWVFSAFLFGYEA